MKTVLATMGALILLLPLPASAGGESVMPLGGTETIGFDDLGPSGLVFPTARKLPNTPSPDITGALVREVERGARFCAQLPQVEYSLDCLSDRMAFTARLVPRIPAYADLRKALSDGAKATRQLARQNRSNTLPTGSATLTSGRTRPLVPFDVAKRPHIEAQTAEIISTASSRMWNVAAKSAEFRPHYEAFAAAMDHYRIYAGPHHGSQS